MKQVSTFILILGCNLVSAQTEKDSIKSKNIEAVTVIAKKPSVVTKVDRTIFEVSNSSILAGNTTWDVVKMTPLVSIDNNDNVKAEGQSVTVYINDRKSVFTGKELKEYLKSLPADNLMKIEVITSPSSRYETSGAVVNIVLKKRADEGVKGSLSLTNSQSRKNSQYGNFNINFHKKKFTQTLIGSYSDNTSISSNYSINSLYQNNELTKIQTENLGQYKSPSISSTSEYEINDKNNIGIVVEYFSNKNNAESTASGTRFIDDIYQDSYLQQQNYRNKGNNVGINGFYKYYNKDKNKIFDVNIGLNYDSNDKTNDFLKNISTSPVPIGTRITGLNQNRNYYLKVDYTTPIDKSDGKIEVGGKIDFHRNDIPNNYFNLEQSIWIADFSKTNYFSYSDNINSVYINYAKTIFKKLETRIGLRYEHIDYKIKQDVGAIEKTDSYGTLLPDVLLKYSLSDNYDITFNYRHSIWRPWYTEFNPFLMPSDDGLYSRGNMNLQPNPSDRFNLKFGIFKKYFISTSYWFSNQDYWDTYVVEGDKTIKMPENFSGKSKKIGVYANTNQSFLKNKLNLNFGIGINYTDNSDFNSKNNLNAKSYFTNINSSANISYTNLFNKNINITGWVGIFTQNNGNTYGNNTNVFHNLSITKIFPATQMEISLKLDNIFQKPEFDGTTYSPIGTFRSLQKWDWHGASITFIKRFGNQKVKENSKTDVEKSSGGAK